MFGSPPPLPSSFIALDLEYISGANTWLIGAYVLDGKERRVVQLWADTATEERRNLRRLARLVEDHPSLPVLTWNGASADVPQLRRLGTSPKLSKVVESIVTNHIDLYQYAVRAVRLPVPSLSLPEVSSYFGVNKLSAVTGGFDAQMRYLAYCQAAGSSRDSLRDELLEYNLDDLVGLVAVAEGFRRLAGSVPAPAA